MELLQINPKTCKQCGTCAAICSRQLIQFQPHNYPEPAEQMEVLCIRCGHCVSICPSGSLTHREVPVEQCPPVRENSVIPAEQWMHFLMSRRSVRAYKNQPVPREIITRLIENARYAPTSHNKQDVEWLVLDNPEKLRNFEEISLQWMQWMIANQPVFAHRFHMDLMLQKARIARNRLLRGAPVLIVAHADKANPLAASNCTVALNYLELSARSLGLGCCWIGMLTLMIRFGFPPAIEALPVPEGHEIYGCLVTGYPRFSFRRIPVRKPPHIIWYP